MPRGDAVQTRPSAAEEMARFTSFAVKDGEPLDASKEDLNPVVGKNTTEGEKESIARQAADKKPAKEAKPAAAEAKPAKATKLTDEESEAAITALDTKLGRPATPDEITDALKNASSGISKQTVRDRLHFALEEKKRERQRARSAEGNARALTARAVAAERERDELRARMTRSDTEVLTGDTKKAKDDAEAAPDPKKFEFGELDAGYMRALARYEAKQEFAAQSENQRKTQLTASQREAAEKFEVAKVAFEEAGEDKYPDFEEVVMQGARDRAYPLSDSLGALLFESEYGPDIAYMLASDPKLAKEIFGKPALQQAAWLGRQEAKLSAGTGATDEDDDADESEDEPAAKVTERKVSKAPAPVQRARGQGSNSSVPGDTTDFRAFEAAAMGRNKP